MIDDAKARELLQKACDRIGGRSCWAFANDVDQSLVSKILNGTRAPTKDVMEKLGYFYAGKAWTKRKPK